MLDLLPAEVARSGFGGQGISLRLFYHHIIRFPFEKMVKENGGWSLVRLNLREAIVPESLGKRAVGINEDIARSIEDIRKEAEKDGGR